MRDFKRRCIELRKKDHTLAEIVKITGRPKTSVYFHIRHIPLSEKRLLLIRKTNGEHIRKYALLREGKSSKLYKPFHHWNEQNVFLVAHLLFDGEIRRGGCFYNNRSETLIQRVERAMKDVYEYPPKYHQNLTTGVYRISYHNVALAMYIRQKAERLQEEVTSFPLDLKRTFVRAFFDDEGCMDFRPEQNRRMVRGYQKNVTTLLLVQTLLHDLGIASRIKKPNEVVIVGKENLKRFQQEINFSPGVRINGKRANSTWKKSLEKRVILERAIRSFL